MLQFRASYDLFLMPPPPPLLVHLLSTSSLSPFPSQRCLYLSATLTVTLSAASGMQSDSQREEGGKNGINMSIWFMVRSGMTQHSPLFSMATEEVRTCTH